MVIAHHLFERAARSQAGVLSMPDLSLVITPRPQPSWSVEETLEHDPTLTERVVDALNNRIAAGAEVAGD